MDAGLQQQIVGRDLEDLAQLEQALDGGVSPIFDMRHHRAANPQRLGQLLPAQPEELAVLSHVPAENVLNLPPSRSRIRLCSLQALRSRRSRSSSSA